MTIEELEYYYSNRPVIDRMKTIYQYTPESLKVVPVRDCLVTTKNESSFLSNGKSVTRNNIFINHCIKNSSVNVGIYRCAYRAAKKSTGRTRNLNK